LSAKGPISFLQSAGTFFFAMGHSSRVDFFDGADFVGFRVRRRL